MRKVDMLYSDDNLKKEMKYKTGDVVYHSSDTGKNITMTIIGTTLMTGEDYVCRWLDKQGIKRQGGFKEEELVMVNSAAD